MQKLNLLNVNLNMLSLYVDIYRIPKHKNSEI